MAGNLGMMSRRQRNNVGLVNLGAAFVGVTFPVQGDHIQILAPTLGLDSPIFDSASETKLVLPEPAFGKSALPAPSSAAATREGHVVHGTPPSATAALTANLDSSTDGGLREDIIVSAHRNRGAVIGDFPIEFELNEADLNALGGGEIGELLTALQPRTGANQGSAYAPVVLLNGRRISDQSEINKLPSEAVERIDILGSEAAMSFGYRPGRKVVNIVLRENFQATTGKLSQVTATDGGYGQSKADLSYTRIAGPARLTFDLGLQRNSGLREAERGISAPPNVDGIPVAEIDQPLAAREPDFRTLVPARRRGEFGASYSRPVSGATNLTINARVALERSKSQFGIPSAILAIPPDNPFAPASASVVELRRYAGDLAPLVQKVETETAQVGMVLDGDINRWNWTLTAKLNHALAKTVTDGGVDLSLVQSEIDNNSPALDPFGPLPDQLIGQADKRTARLTSDAADLLLEARGPILDLPAGTSWLNLKVGGSAFRIRPTVRDGSIVSKARLSREEAVLSGIVTIPVAGKNAGASAGLGELSFNVGAELREVSDYGSLINTAYSINWRPSAKLSFQASYLKDRQAPSMQQLGGPVIVTPYVRLFDFGTGDTLEVTRSEGGNRALREADSEAIQLGLVYQLLSGRRSVSLSADYSDTTTHDQLGYLSAATAEFQEAFPERFVRGSEGRIIAFDARPVNFARADTKQLRWGLQFALPLNGAEPDGASANGPKNSSAGGRILGSLSYLWKIDDKLVLRRGLAPLDHLAGVPNGFPGNSPRHEIRGQLGLYKGGIGTQASFQWQSRSVLRDIGHLQPGQENRLIFRDRLRLDATVFMDFDKQKWLAGGSTWTKGTRLSVTMKNLFNARLRVHDVTGQTPFSYQPAFLDPIGRTFSISLRKQF